MSAADSWTQNFTDDNIIIYSKTTGAASAWQEGEDATSTGTGPINKNTMIFPADQIFDGCRISQLALI